MNWGVLYPLDNYIKVAKWDIKNDVDLCFILDTGWNTLDEFVPLLTWINENMPEKRVLSILIETNSGEMQDIHRKDYETLLSLSAGVIKNNWKPCKWKWLERLSFSIFKKSMKQGILNLMKKLLSNISIKCVFCCTTNSYGYYTVKNIYRLNMVYVSHEQCGFLSMSSNNYRTEMKEMDACFLTSEYDKVFYPRDTSIFITGSPKADLYWQEKIQKKIKLKEVSASCCSSDNELINAKKISILLPRLQSSYRVNTNEINELVKFIRGNRQYHYIIKFHPRDNKKLQNQFFDKIEIDKSIFTISNDSLTEIAYQSDCTIMIGKSSGAADILFTKKPIVEFYEAIKTDYFYKCSDGKYGSFLRLYKCVPWTDNAKDLSEIVNKIINGNLWEKYMDRFDKFIPHGNNCKEISKIIFDMIPGRVNY